MTIKINTRKLQELVSKALKGASDNKQIPLTSLMLIQASDGSITLGTTDGTNYLFVYEDEVEDTEFYVVVGIEKFSKLIARFTCDEVTLRVDEEHLVVKGNGTYYIELPLNEEGKPVHFPRPEGKLPTEPTSARHIEGSMFKQILASAKSSLYSSMDAPVYTGYYAADKVIATDINTVCSVKLDKELADMPVLIRSEVMDLLDLVDPTKYVFVEMYAPDTMAFSADGLYIYSKTMPDIETFAINEITALIDEEYPYQVEVAKDKLLQTLDRLALFVGPYDNGSVALEFNDTSLFISSKQNDGAEDIAYLSANFEPNEFEFLTYSINIDMLKTRIKSNSVSAVSIQFGRDNGLKIVDGNVTHIVAFEEV